MKLAFVLLVILALSAPAIADVQIPAKAMRSANALQCEETRITKTGYYFEGDPSSGIYAVFETSLGMSSFPHAHASITDRNRYIADDGKWTVSPSYSGGPNPVMIQERIGDHVQVCLVGMPTPSAQCDPEKDSRGRVYRVYDYRLHAAYSGENANHTCGGA